MNARELRVAAILKAPKPGTAPQVKTSPAFAARFQAEADRSGLSIELEERAIETLFVVCSVCGAQNGRMSAACYNCQSELTAPPPPVAKARKPATRFELRYARLDKPALPARVVVPVNRARFERREPPAPLIDTGAIANRFLAVFIEREKTPHQPAKELERFDQRSMFDRFLSVFVQRG